jgi:hypothetical protein
MTSSIVNRTSQEIIHCSIFALVPSPKAVVIKTLLASRVAHILYCHLASDGEQVITYNSVLRLFQIPYPYETKLTKNDSRLITISNRVNHTVLGYGTMQKVADCGIEPAFIEKASDVRLNQIVIVSTSQRGAQVSDGL